MTTRLLLVAVWVVYVLVGHRYAAAWGSDDTLWNHALSQTPENPLARMNAAVVNHPW